MFKMHVRNLRKVDLDLMVDLTIKTLYDTGYGLDGFKIGEIVMHNDMMKINWYKENNVKEIIDDINNVHWSLR